MLEPADAGHAVHPHAELVRRFYVAFSVLDWRVMADCYTPDARFEDPVFRLEGARIGLMWRMLCSSARDFTLEFSDVTADATQGRAHWEPRYRFAATGRTVHNVIDAQFTFRDGRIATHVDRFDFWRWSRQALGAPGWLLGWSDGLRNKVRAEANRRLDRYVAQIGAA